MDVLRLVEGRVFRKAMASSNGGGCVGLERDGKRDAVVDFKSNQVLSVSCAGLVTWAKEIK